LNYSEKEIERELDKCRKKRIKGIKLITHYKISAEGKRVEFS